ncbi:MAG: hypothetical protein DRJ35_07920 [Thermoprotei archaeon]|nr:MAG: hypothetical protein DRJ35_07920 [Thermoprotei archaeon]
MIYMLYLISMSILRIALLFAFRDMKFRRMITLLNIVIIASGIGAFTALRITNAGSRIAAERIVTNILSGEILVYGEGLYDMSELAVEDIESISGVAKALPVMLVVGYMDGSLAFIMGVRSRDLGEVVSEYVAGGRFGENDSRVVIVESNFAETRNLSVGDYVYLKPQIGSVSIPYKVVGVADIGMKIQELSVAGTYVVVPLREAQDMVGRMGYVTMVMVKVDKGASVSAVKERIKEVFPEARIFEREEVMSIVNKVISLIDGLLMSSTMIGLLIALFSTASTIMSNVREHARDIAVMRSIGIKMSYVATIFIVEALIYSALGGALGIVLGIIGGEALRNMISSTGILRQPLIIEPTLLLFNYLAALGVGFMASIYPVVKASQVKPVEVLKNE